MTDFSQVNDVLGSAIDRGDVPGVVAMAATRDEVVYQGAFGRRAPADEAAMSTDTVFWIASMTKAITSVAAMQLVEQGKDDRRLVWITIRSSPFGASIARSAAA